MKGKKNKYRLLLLLVALVASNFLFAQSTLSNKGTLIHINQGAFITIFGNAELLEDSVLDVKGQLKITGNINSGSKKPFLGEGSTTFFGPSDQYIFGDSLIRFNDLIVEKSDGMLFLQSDIEIKNELILNGGIIDIGSHNIFLNQSGKILYENNSNYITGSTGYISVKAVLNTPLNVQPGNVGASITSLNNFGMTLILRDHQTYILGGNSSIKRRYQIIPSNSNNISAVVTFKYTDNPTELNSISETSLSSYSWDTTTWFLKASVVNPSNDEIIVASLNNLGAFTFGPSSSTLPVEFSYFDVQALNNEVVALSWTTATEINNDYFTIQRSTNGIDFTDLQKITGAGNSSEITNYKYLDQEALSGLSYYRIKQTDFDGAFDYTETKAVFINKNLDLVVYPNPLQGQDLFISGLEQKVSIELCDTRGQVMLSHILNPDAPSEINALNLNELAPGMYFYNISNDNGPLKTGNLIKL